MSQWRGTLGAGAISEGANSPHSARASRRSAESTATNVLAALGRLLGVNAIATVDAFKQSLDDPSLSNVLSVVGNATALIGSAISLFPALLPVGKLVEAIGTGLVDMPVRWYAACFSFGCVPERGCEDGP